MSQIFGELTEGLTEGFGMETQANTLFMLYWKPIYLVGTGIRGNPRYYLEQETD